MALRSKKKRGPAAILALWVFGAAGFAVLLFFLTAWLSPLPDDSAFAYPQSRRIFDKKGVLLREAVNKDGLRSEWISLEEMSPYTIASIIAVEDERFRTHIGVDLIAIARAAIKNIAGANPRSGASTITMQLSRILFKSGHDFWGKLKQTWQALRIERFRNKDWILEQYLNRVSFGAGCIGISAASKRFFGKPASHLSLAEAAMLAGIPQSPTSLDPLKAAEKTEERRAHVLDRLAATKAYPIDLINEARATLPVIGDYAMQVKAGHFTDYVLSLTKDGGDIGTTLDSELNDMVQGIISEHVSRLERYGLTNAAALVIDNTDGSILAMVGSRDWSQEDNGSVNGALSPRQPGSALKPFLYALAFSRSLDPGTILPDVETEYYGIDRSLYVPQNYSLTFRGPVTAKEALAMSLNIPALRLASALGVDNVLATLRDFGFASLGKDPEHYGLGLVIGNGEVTLLELAQAYSTLARNGIAMECTPFQNSDAYEATQILDEQSSWLVTSILGDEQLRIQGFGTSNPLILGFPMAIKTGTSNEWRDAWAIGYTRRYTIAVWAGDFAARPMDHIAGAAGAGTILARIANVLRHRDPSGFVLPEQPQGLKLIRVCAESGQIPGPYCSRIISVYTRQERVETLCSVHKLVTIDTRTNTIAAPGCPAKYTVSKVVRYLPPVYDEWLMQAGYPVPPRGLSDLKKAGIVIKKPRTGDVFIIEPGYDLKTQTIELKAEGLLDYGPIEWLVDGKVVAKVDWPYDSYWRLERGEHTVIARSGNIVSAEVKITVK